MKIYVPTRGRAAKQATLSAIPEKLRAQVTLALTASDTQVPAYQELHQRCVVYDCSGIGHKRQLLVESAGCDKILMLDDDLSFYARRDDDRSKFRDASESDVLSMLDSIDAALDDYALVGIAAREGGNRVTTRTITNTRVMRVLGYRADVLRSNQIRFDRLRVMEDFDVALQLLRLGYENIVLNDWCHNQVGGSGAAGGCSSYRSLELQAEAARGLAQLHAPYVRTVEKQTKVAWGGAKRTDVVIGWKAALRRPIAVVPQL